jgi:hypothetical protein
MTKKIISTLFCLMLIVSSFDLKAASLDRKGFVIGIGLGGGLTTYKTDEWASGFKHVYENGSSPGLATDFKIGYGISNNLLLIYTNKVLWFSFKDPDWPEAHEAQLTITGASMASLSYFFEPTTPSSFASAGIGMSTWSGLSSTDEHKRWSGLGLFAGFGYELSPHLMLEFSVLFELGGKDEDYSSGKNPCILMVTFHWLGY